MNMLTRIALGCGVVLAAAQPAAAQFYHEAPHVVRYYEAPRVHQAYRLSYKTEYDIREMTAYRIEYETEYREETVVTYKPEVTEEIRERHYTVQKPVEQTSYRTTYRTVYKPQTSYRTRYVDRGGWVEQTAIVPGRKYLRFGWQPGMSVVDPTSGVTTHYRGGLSLATVQRPDRAVVHRSWKPNVVAEAVPYTTYVAETVEEQTPFTTYKMVTEHRVEKIPVRVTRMVRVEEVRQVPYRVKKRVPFVYQQRIPRVVTYYTPIDACGRAIGLTTLRPVIVVPADDMTIVGPPAKVDDGKANGADAKPKIEKDENVPPASDNKPADPKKKAAASNKDAV